MIIGNHEIRADIIDAPKTAGVNLLNVLNNKNAIANMKIHRSMKEPYGDFQIELSPAFYDEDFINEVKVNTIVRLYVDDKLVSEGLMLKPTVTGQTSQGGDTKRQVILRGFELAYLLQDVNKIYGEYLDTYIGAEATAWVKAGTIYESDRLVNIQVKRTYKIIMDAIKTLNNGVEYQFIDGKKLSDVFGADGNKVFVFAEDAEYHVRAPVSIQLLQPDMSVMDYIKRIADPTFSEVYGDVFNNGDQITLGSKISKVSTNGAYGIVVRPKILGKYWATAKRVLVNDNYYQYSAMKDGTQAYNYFVVGNSVGMSTNFQEATGKAVRYMDKIRQFGYKPFKADVHSVWAEDDRDGISEKQLTDLTNEIASWYVNAENFISGQISMPYTDKIKLGDIMQFKLPKSDILYEAIVDQIDLMADAQGNRLNNVFTVTHGRKAVKATGNVL